MTDLQIEKEIEFQELLDADIANMSSEMPGASPIFMNGYEDHTAENTRNLKINSAIYKFTQRIKLVANDIRSFLYGFVPVAAVLFYITN